MEKRKEIRAAMQRNELVELREEKKKIERDLFRTRNAYEKLFQEYSVLKVSYTRLQFDRLEDWRLGRISEVA